MANWESGNKTRETKWRPLEKHLVSQLNKRVSQERRDLTITGASKMKTLWQQGHDTLFKFNKVFLNYFHVLDLKPAGAPIVS